MSSDMKDIGLKTTGGITTYVGTYIATLTIQDLQAYSIIFASIATGLYYLVAAYTTWKHKKKDKR